jgi:hypothetical protein
MNDSRDIAFDETQRAWRNRFITTIIACESMILTAILGAFAAKATGNARTEILIAWVVCVILMPGLILSFRLRTRIVGHTLRVWFPPFPAWKIDLRTIRHAEHKKLNPMGDLGGWGYKWTRKHGHAMNVHGEQFVVLTLNNDKVRTIGTQRPEELLTAIRVLAELPPDESELSNEI